jgi:Fe-S-cluster containining protein
MYHHQAKLKFTCTGCGKCCIGRANDYVLLQKEEAENIRHELGLGKDWFRRRYLVRLQNGHNGIKLNQDGRCPFLLQGGGCRVYRARPIQCRTYPFWPEIIASKRDWDSEAKRCEGINNGKIWPTDEIDRLLALDPENSI